MLCSTKEQGVSKLCYHAISRIKTYLTIASAGLSPTQKTCGNNELKLCRVCLLLQYMIIGRFSGWSNSFSSVLYLVNSYFAQHNSLMILCEIRLQLSRQQWQCTHASVQLFNIVAESIRKANGSYTSQMQITLLLHFYRCVYNLMSNPI